MNLSTILMLAVGMLSIFAVFAYVISLGHRFFGPIVPLSSHIDKLISGDYSARVKLRKGDELHELADKLNKLAAILEKS